MSVGKLVILWPIAQTRSRSLPRRTRGKSNEDKEGKSMRFKKNKGNAYRVGWDSDTSSSSEDEKTPSKFLVGVAIYQQEALHL